MVKSSIKFQALVYQNGDYLEEAKPEKYHGEYNMQFYDVLMLLL